MMTTAGFAPFDAGPFEVEARSIELRDAARNRVFPCDLWRPATHEPAPLVLYSHASMQHRRIATFLTTHLASHGYIVAALDHSEVVAPELGRREGESDAERAARLNALIASRVPDVRFLLDSILAAGDPAIDPSRIGIVGHSFGGWTALEAAASDARFSAVVAHAPGGASNPRPGILPLKLTFAWQAPALFLVAENDASLPLDGMEETFGKTTSPKLMVILRRADHMHFVDEVARLHEGFRTMPVPPMLASMQQEMRPMAELTSQEQAHLFVRGLTLAHLDAHLRDRDAAREFLASDLTAELALHGVEARVRRA
jgi:dienelactone hydrolase